MVYGFKMVLIKVWNNGKKIIVNFFFCLIWMVKKNVCFEKYKFKYLDIKK